MTAAPPTVIGITTQVVHPNAPRGPNGTDHKTAAPKARPMGRREIAQAIIDSRRFPFLDLCLDGAAICRARAGYVITLAGPTGAGKSSLAIGIIDHFARHLGHAMVLSIELTAAEFGARHWGMLRNISWEKAMNEIGDVAEIEEALPERLDLWERHTATLANADESLRVLRAETDEPILTVIDYGQLLAAQDRDVRLNVGKVWTDAGVLAKRHSAIVLLLSRMSRASSKAARAGDRLGAEAMDGGAESALIEYESYVTLELGAVGDEADDGSRPVSISVGKGRMGGGDRVIPATWWPQSGRYRIDGDSEPASGHRERIRSEKRESRLHETSASLVEILKQSKTPLSKRALVVKSKLKQADVFDAIEICLSAGTICFVQKKAGGANLLWIPALAHSAGMGVVE